MNKLKIWHDGLPQHARISVVADDGAETALDLVERIDFSSDCTGPARLTLQMCFGNVLELEIPLRGEDAAKVLEVNSMPIFEAAQGDARQRVRQAIEAAGIDLTDAAINLGAQEVDAMLGSIVWEVMRAMINRAGTGGLPAVRPRDIG